MSAVKKLFKLLIVFVNNLLCVENCLRVLHVVTISCEVAIKKDGIMKPPGEGGRATLRLQIGNCFQSPSRDKRRWVQLHALQAGGSRCLGLDIVSRMYLCC